MIIQNLILAMSLSGSVIVLLYLITCPLAKPYVPVKWKFLILKLAVVFYLVPFPLYMEHSLTLRRLRRMNPLMRKLFPPLEDRMPYIRKQAEKLSVLIDDSGYAVFSRELKVMAAITALLLLIVFVLLTWNLIRYEKARRLCLFNAKEADADRQNLCFRLKQELGLRRKVRLICSDSCKSPVVMGILRPMIVLPLKDKGGDVSDEYIMRHELLHIRNHDLAVKFLGFAALALHWFNPLCYILYYELMNMSEMCCDSDVIKGKDKNAQKEYGTLLLNLATERGTEDASHFVSGLLHGSGRYVMKRRLSALMKSPKKTRFFPALLTAFIATAGLLAGFAYTGPRILSPMAEKERGSREEILLHTVKGLGEAEIVFTEFLLSDYDWIDKNGEIHSPDESPVHDKACSHEFCRDGELYLHEGSPSNGSMAYEALKCSKCGSIRNGNRIILIPSDNYWIDKDLGTVTPQSTGPAPNPCSRHIPMEGTACEHRKDSTGNCRTTLYEGWRCALCGYTEAEVSVGEYTSYPCMHTYGYPHDT